MRPACYDTENGAVYCDQCAPDIEPEAMPQECDSPQNCENCGAQLEYSLTADGVAYVMEHVIEALERGVDATIRDSLPQDTYYNGMPQCSVVGDWARDLRNYGGLSQAEKYCLDTFIEQVDAAEKSVTH